MSMIIYIVLEYQKEVRRIPSSQGSLQGYSLGASSEIGIQELKALKIYFPLDVIKQGGLFPTVTGCVRSNDPGALGKYRNGALTLQVLDAGSVELSSLGVATKGLLYEATIFYHHSGECYGAPGYIR